MVENGRRRLTSWKEIATHMGRDVRTVLRWEKQRGLPVHRVPGATGRVVFAYTDELDAWAKGRTAETGAAVVPEPVPEPSQAAVPEPAAAPSAESSRASWHRTAVAAGIAVAVIAVGVATLATKISTGPAARALARAEVTDTAVRATSADGGVLWTYPLVRGIQRSYSKAVVTDLNDDGQPDVAASLIIHDSSNAGTQGALLALDHRGRKLWERDVQDTLAFGTDSFGPTWAPDDLISYVSGGEPRLAWALHHHTWWPSLLAVYNGRGERTSTFVNSGWIRNITASADGKYLLAGGISNARNGASFAILDAHQPGGASPEDPRSPYECRNCPEGMPVRYFVMPWSDVIEPTILGGRRGTFAAFPDGRLELRAVQRQNAEMIVELTPSLEIKSRRLSDGFWSVHAELEREGLLKHSRDGCPFRNGPTVLEWMPEHGWRELKP
jgi:hypothetical protein